MHRLAFNSPNRQRGGFTLLEIIVAVALMTMLITAVFGVVAGTSELSTAMQRRLDREASAHAFAQLGSNIFRSLGPESQVRLRVGQSGKQYVSDLAIKNAPPTIGGASPEDTMIIRSEPAPDGYLRIIIAWMTSEESAAAELGRGTKPQRQLVLLDKLASFEWRAYDPQTRQWVTVWNEKLSFSAAVTGSAVPRQPSLFDLVLQDEAGNKHRFVFWIPPASLPQAIAPTQPATPQVPEQNQNPTK